MIDPPGIVFLISRPVAQYEAAAKLGGFGATWFEPPLDFHFLPVAKARATAPTGAIFSSQTAVEAASAWLAAGTQCWTIGSATAQAATAAGFRVKHWVDGGGQAFVQALDQGDFSLPATGVLWPSAKSPAFDLVSSCQQRGIGVEYIAAYDAQPKLKPSDALSAWLMDHPRAAVALFSVGSGGAFEQWHKLQPSLWRPVAILAIGPRVSSTLKVEFNAPITWPEIASRDSFAKMLGNFRHEALESGSN